MKARLRRVHSPDVLDLATYRPEPPDSFYFLLQAMVGPEGQPGEESFDIVVCTPRWLMEHRKPDEVIIGRHHILVFQYDYKRLITAIENYLATCVGDTWGEVARRVGRLGKWEFADHKPLTAKQPPATPRAGT